MTLTLTMTLIPEERAAAPPNHRAWLARKLAARRKKKASQGIVDEHALARAMGYDTYGHLGNHDFMGSATPACAYYNSGPGSPTNKAQGRAVAAGGDADEGFNLGDMDGCLAANLLAEATEPGNPYGPYSPRGFKSFEGIAKKVSTTEYGSLQQCLLIYLFNECLLMQVEEAPVSPSHKRYLMSEAIMTEHQVGIRTRVRDSRV